MKTIPSIIQGVTLSHKKQYDIGTMTETNYLQKYVAKKVKYHRTQQGLSQEKLSEKAGLGLKYVNNIENKNYNLRLQTLEKVIEALGMTPEEFFDFSSLEGKTEPDTKLSIRRLTMKLKQLPKEKQESFLMVFETILDNLD